MYRLVSYNYKVYSEKSQKDHKTFWSLYHLTDDQDTIITNIHLTLKKIILQWVP